MLTRRKLLASIAVLAGGGGLAAWLGLRWRSRTERAVLELAAELPAAAGEIGRRYLAGLKAKPNREELAHSLAAELDKRPTPVGRGQAVRTVAARVAAAVRAEYTAGETVEVDGWVLARTEARLYALRALQLAGEPHPAAL